MNDSKIILELIKDANKNSGSRTRIAYFKSAVTEQEFYVLTREQLELLGNLKLSKDIDDEN